jgi:hypothetical protein
VFALQIYQCYSTTSGVCLRTSSMSITFISSLFAKSKYLIWYHNVTPFPWSLLVEGFVSLCSSVIWPIEVSELKVQCLPSSSALALQLGMIVGFKALSNLHSFSRKLMVCSGAGGANRLSSCPDKRKMWPSACRIAILALCPDGYSNLA